MVSLEPNTSFQEIKKLTSIIVYHSCGVDNFVPRENLHTGSFLQTLFRADYKINDEGLYKHGYVYKLEISLEGLSEELMLDDGFDSDISFEDSLKNKFNVVAYKNVAEGFKKDKNLSLLVLREKNIVSCKLDSIWSGPAIESYLYDYENV